jgi:hypothetical protein
MEHGQPVLERQISSRNLTAIGSLIGLAIGLAIFFFFFFFDPEGSLTNGAL